MRDLLLAMEPGEVIVLAASVINWLYVTLAAAVAWGVFHLEMLQKRQLTIRSILILTAMLAIAWTLLWRYLPIIHIPSPGPT